MWPLLKIAKELLVIGIVAGLFYVQFVMPENHADKGNYCPLDGVISVQSPPVPCC